MKENLVRLFKGTFIYSGGQVFSRLITFCLLPITTSYLTPEDYGIIGILATIGVFLNGIYTLGFGVSLSRCYWSTENISERHGIIWSGFTVLFCNACILTLLSIILSKQISVLLLGSDIYSHLVVVTMSSMAFSSVILPFASLFRMEERAPLVVTLSIVEVLVSIGLTLFFVISLNLGAAGVIYAGAISQSLSFLLMFLICFFQLKITFCWHYVPEMLKIGYPYIFGLLGICLLQTTSRYMLEFYLDKEAVGLYFMGNNFAQITTLIVGGFVSAWPPFFTSFLNKQEEALHLFGRVLSYYLLGMGTITILFFLTAKPIVLIMVQAPFHNVWTTVGILATTQALVGVYSISAAGLIFYKKSSWQVFMEIGAGLVCICLNILLIPLLKKEGAALATLLSYLTLVGISFAVNLRLLPVKYEIDRIIKIVIGFSVVAAVSFVPIASFYSYCFLMFIMFIFWIFYSWNYCLTFSEKEYITNKIRSSPLPSTP